MKRHEVPPQVHSPPVQPSSFIPSHVLPQPPQLPSSVCVLTHAPEQHSCEPEHTRPHAPQFATVSVRAQVPPQQLSPPLHARALAPVPQRHWSPMHVVPAGQLTVHGTVHEPPTQERPAGHALPQRPQWPALVFVSTQPPPQHVCVPVHAAPAPQRHVPDMHVSPTSHAGVHIEAPVSRTGPVSRGGAPVSGIGPESGLGPVSGTGPVSRGNGASMPIT
jgi:hypothetical protein